MDRTIIRMTMDQLTIILQAVPPHTPRLRLEVNRETACRGREGRLGPTIPPLKS